MEPGLRRARPPGGGGSDQRAVRVGTSERAGRVGSMK